MKKLFTLNLFVLIILSSITAQPALKWSKNFGGSGDDQVGDVTNYKDAPNHCIVSTSDSGFVLVGYSSSNDVDVISNYGSNDFLLIRCDAGGNKLWSKSYGGTGNDQATSVIQTLDGGFAICGFSNSNDSNITNNHGGYDVVIIKLDSSGNVQWEHSYGGSFDDKTQSFIQTADGGYAVGAYSNSNNGDVGNNIGSRDFWFFKVDSIGIITASKTFGGTGDDWVNSIASTADNGFILSGWTTSSNFDVTFNAGLTDFWVVKTDSIGNLLWQKTYGGSLNDWSTCIIQNSIGNYTISGYTESSNGQVTGAHGGLDFWIIQIDSAGVLLWQKDIGGTANDEAYEIFETTDGFLAAGSTNSDNGEVVGNFGQFDFLIVKLDTTGNLIWTKTYGGSTVEWAVSAALRYSGDILVAGSTSSSDFNIKANYGGYDLWVLDLTMNYNSISGKYFIDVNNDSIYNAGDVAIANKLIRDTITDEFTFTDSNGVYNLQVVDTGSFFIKTDSLRYHSILPASYTVNFSGLNMVDSFNDFAAIPVPGMNDLSISITPLARFRPGFNSAYMISYANLGTTTLTASITLALDSELTFQSADLTPSLINGDTILWNVINVLPGHGGNITVYFNVDLTLQIGDTILSWVMIDGGVSDLNPEDNVSSWASHITGSFDPNDKAVSTEAIYTNQLIAPAFLDYVIRFQNTGNDTAFTVLIRDIISDFLDINTYEFVAASHPVTTEFDQQTRLLTFKFNNILLIDSGSNQISSHGFIHYRIKPLSTLQLNDQIFNSANIYFDFNIPIITDSVVSSVMLPTNINAPLVLSDIIIYPNPASQYIHLRADRKILSAVRRIEIFDGLGKKVYSSNINGSTEDISIPIQQLTIGTYLVEISTTDETLVKSLIKF